MGLAHGDDLLRFNLSRYLACTRTNHAEPQCKSMEAKVAATAVWLWSRVNKIWTKAANGTGRHSTTNRRYLMEGFSLESKYTKAKFAGTSANRTPQIASHVLPYAKAVNTAVWFAGANLGLKAINKYVRVDTITVCQVVAPPSRQVRTSSDVIVFIRLIRLYPPSTSHSNVSLNVRVTFCHYIDLKIWVRTGELSTFMEVRWWDLKIKRPPSKENGASPSSLAANGDITIVQ